jgi:hypothetical protein
LQAGSVHGTKMEACEQAMNDGTTSIERSNQRATQQLTGEHKQEALQLGGTYSADTFNQPIVVGRLFHDKFDALARFAILLLENGNARFGTLQLSFQNRVSFVQLLIVFGNPGMCAQNQTSRKQVG